jgi:hypothetical protein
MHYYALQVRMEPQFMILGHSAGVAAAIAANSSRALAATNGLLGKKRDSTLLPLLKQHQQVAVHDVDRHLLKALLLHDGQRLDKHTLPPGPRSPNPFVCGADRCFQSDSAHPVGVHGTYPDGTCTDAKSSKPACAGLGGKEWLALKQHWRLDKFIERRSTGGSTGGSTMTALEDTTLKKSELSSTVLPAPSKRAVAKGMVVALTAPAVAADGAYYLVALAPAFPTAPADAVGFTA